MRDRTGGGEGGRKGERTGYDLKKHAARRKSFRGEEARTKRKEGQMGGEGDERSVPENRETHAGLTHRIARRVFFSRRVNIFYLLTNTHTLKRGWWRGRDVSCRGTGFYIPRTGIYVSPPCLSV